MKATARNNRETEVKLAMPDANAARRILRAAGFRVSRARIFESNTLFDTAQLGLRSAGSLLRIREAGNQTTLTYKGKPEPARHKSREELETTVCDAGELAGILERIGFCPIFRYEKYRTEFEQPGVRGHAMIDEIPLGVYVELEGTPGWIDRTARALGFSEKDYITASYGRLYLDWCAREGVEPSHMVFHSRAKRPRRLSQP